MLELQSLFPDIPQFKLLCEHQSFFFFFNFQTSETDILAKLCQQIQMPVVTKVPIFFLLIIMLFVLMWDINTEFCEKNYTVTLVWESIPCESKQNEKQTKNICNID